MERATGHDGDVTELSLQELADRTNEPIERLVRWRDLGFFDPNESQRYSLDDLGRIQMLQLALRSGFDAEALEQEPAQLRSLFDRFMEWLRPPERAYPFDAAAERLGAEPEVIRPIWEASGLGDEFEEVGDEDIVVMAGLKYAITSGLPEEALVQLTRVYVDALRRVGEAEVRLFHIYVHERLASEGISGQELDDAVSSASTRLQGLVEPSVLYFHQRAFKRAMQEDLMLHVGEVLGLREPTGVLGQIVGGVAFVDLSSFTPLTQAMGDEKAAMVIGRFSELVREAVRGAGGRILKQIGDAFMLLFNDATTAVLTVLTIRDLIAAEPEFPASRAGVHWGPMLYREGDYVGSVVNIASRLVNEAGRHDVVVTAEVRRETSRAAAIEFVPLGRAELKGVAEEVELFKAQRETDSVSDKVVDPVCGMELRPNEVVARLDFQGTERHFCSNECLQLFVSNPQRYESA